MAIRIRYKVTTITRSNQTTQVTNPDGSVVSTDIEVDSVNLNPISVTDTSNAKVFVATPRSPLVLENVAPAAITELVLGGEVFLDLTVVPKGA